MKFMLLVLTALPLFVGYPAWAAVTLNDVQLDAASGGATGICACSTGEKFPAFMLGPGFTLEGAQHGLPSIQVQVSQLSGVNLVGEVALPLTVISHH